MLFDTWFKTTSRRAEIRKKLPDRFGTLWQDMRSHGVWGSLGIATVFCVLAMAIVMLREDAVPYRPGQYVPQDVLSRVDFTFQDKAQLMRKREEVRQSTPNVYKEVGEPWANVEKALLDLAEVFAPRADTEGREKLLTPQMVPARLREELQLERNPGAFTELTSLQAPELRKEYERDVARFIDKLRRQVFVLDDWGYRREMEQLTRHVVTIGGELRDQVALFPVTGSDELKPQHQLLEARVREAAELPFGQVLRPSIVSLTMAELKATHQLDVEATTDAQNKAAERVSRDTAKVDFRANQVIVPKGVITERDWQVLRVEKEQFVRMLGNRALEGKAGLAGTALVLTCILCAYIARFQPRVVRNHARGIAIAALFLSMLLLAQLAAIGTGPLYLFGIAPTLLVAMILAIAYDQRFAMGIASMHGILATTALDQGIGFFLILWIGILTCSFLLDEIRTRSKLIEVGGAAALAMIVATIAAGATSLDPIPFIAKNCLYTGAAGLACGFIVLGILPFIEKAFRITTSMTLLELADASQPLLRRLALEAPGTYNHSLQVATLCEAAAEAIGSNSLLCRVGAYYHDIGKMNKPDYFVENQIGGRNRHINLNPNVSFLIITGHVKDGMAMAKEYNLPTHLLPFIQQHHGTTLVEYFYNKACNQKDIQNPDSAPVADTEYRYSGPKPKTKEIAILMVADAVESATRALKEPSARSIEELVHELAMKRLLDGQFDECDLTMRELELIERAMAKTLQGIYHGRIAYPPTPSKMMAQIHPTSTGASSQTPAGPRLAQS